MPDKDLTRPKIITKPSIAGSVRVRLEYEDELEMDITEGMMRASVLDGVRLYPYVLINGRKYYLENVRLGHLTGSLSGDKPCDLPHSPARGKA